VKHGDVVTLAQFVYSRVLTDPAPLSRGFLSPML